MARPAVEPNALRVALALEPLHALVHRHILNVLPQGVLHGGTARKKTQHMGRDGDLLWDLSDVYVILM